MSMKFSEEQGEMAVRAARKVIDSYLRGQNAPELELPVSFEDNGGVFVTIKTFPEEALRGCIGYPEPIAPLRDALVDSAISAATRDPRFPPMTPSELSGVVIEVSLLTTPEPIQISEPKELLSKVVVGEDGLICERGWARGLLLPQVPVEWNWEVEEFLSHTCNKAGLSMDAWRDPSTKFFKFQAEVFSEDKPNGGVVRKMLSD